MVRILSIIIRIICVFVAIPLTAALAGHINRHWATLDTWDRWGGAGLLTIFITSTLACVITVYVDLVNSSPRIRRLRRRLAASKCANSRNGGTPCDGSDD